MPGLSPMRLGPVPTAGFADADALRALGPGGIAAAEGGMAEELAQARTVEAYHQCRKVYASETDPAGPWLTQSNGTRVPPPSLAFFRDLRAEFANSEPRRHKPAEFSGGRGGRKNVPLYQLWREPGTLEESPWRALTYAESRRLYCKEYARLAEGTDELVRLRNLHSAGFNLDVWGYDGQEGWETMVPWDWDESCGQNEGAGWYKAHMAHGRIPYDDLSRPFGHEMVLLLLIEAVDNNYPWKYSQDDREEAATRAVLLKNWEHLRDRLCVLLGSTGVKAQDGTIRSLAEELRPLLRNNRLQGVRGATHGGGFVDAEDTRPVLSALMLEYFIQSELLRTSKDPRGYNRAFIFPTLVHVEGADAPVAGWCKKFSVA